MRISFLASTNLVNSNYRTYQPMMSLAARGHRVAWNRPGEARLQPERLWRSDVVHVHRFIDPEVQLAMQRLREAGIGVVWDNDDDITNVPRSNPNHASFSGVKGSRIAAALGTVIRLADVVTTPSERLAEQFRIAGADDVRVVENFLPDAFADARRVAHEATVVVWLAALEHQADYQALRLRDTFGRILDAHADVRIISIGLGLGLRHERYEHVPAVSFLEIPRALARCDIGIAPLVDIPWNHARSNVKLKEYAAAGLPWLASPIGAYASMGEAQGGRLVPADGWYASIDTLVKDARARRKLAKAASRWAKRQTISKHVDCWESALTDAAQRARARVAGAVQ